MQASAHSLIIVEDEPLLAAMLAQEVEDLGWKVVGIAHCEESAFALLNASAPNVAVLDINLDLGTSLAVAATCRDRNISIVFTTGYSTDDLPRQCEGATILTKPFSFKDLGQALDHAMDPAAPSEEKTSGRAPDALA